MNRRFSGQNARRKQRERRIDNLHVPNRAILNQEIGAALKRYAPDRKGLLAQHYCDRCRRDANYRKHLIAFLHAHKLEELELRLRAALRAERSVITRK